MYLFVGSYTGGKPGRGIYVYRMDTATGRLLLSGHGEGLINPSFVSISADGTCLYACTETRMRKAGSVSAFRFDAVNGTLTFMNKQPAGGENPVYIAIDKSRQWLICANYTGGSLAALPIAPDGSLQALQQLIPFRDSSVNMQRQESAHIHAAVFSPDDHVLFAPDLGADKIRMFHYDSGSPGPIVAATPSFVHSTTGSGPRHFVFHPNGHFAYCSEELSGTVVAYDWANGQLTPTQRIKSYAADQQGYACSDLHISPDGRFLYVANREAEHSISVFAVDSVTGTLAIIGRQSTIGRHPRFFTIDPTGNFLVVANQAGNCVVVFRRNKASGFLTYTGYKKHIHHPSCVQIRSYKNE